ncbi:MAG: hypothetical protein ACUVWR_06995 [Anaerolineae bacterium]
MAETNERDEPSVAAFLAETRRDLLARGFRSFMAAVAIALFLGWCYLSIRMSSNVVLVAVLVGTALLGLAVAFYHRAPRLAATALVLAVLFITLYLAQSTDRPVLLALLAVPVLMAGAFFAPVAALALGVLAAMGAYLAGAMAASWLLVAAPIVVGLAAWLAFRPLYSLMELSCQQCARAIMLSEELRDQRGKLNRTIKDLDASYQLLHLTKAITPALDPLWLGERQAKEILPELQVQIQDLLAAQE